MFNLLKLKHKFNIVSLLILVQIITLLLFAGCTANNANLPDSGSNISAPAGGTQNTASPAPVNRYNEVFDATKDAGKLVVRFLYTSTGTETKSGDSTIIKTPDGKIMLIDGSAPEAAHTLTTYLKALGITKIDAIVASHPHIDHIGGLTQIVYQYDVGKVYRSALEYQTATNQNFLKAVEDRGIETVILKDGMSFDFGETKVDVYSPVGEFKYPSNYPEASTAFINDNSIVLKMTYKDSKVLLPGDLYVGGEKSLLDRHEKDIQADILKMPHHGDETSSSSTFITAVQPKVAVAMYDKLASLNVYNSYRKRGSLAYITAIDGSVKIVADGTREYKIVTEKDRTSDFLK